MSPTLLRAGVKSNGLIPAFCEFTLAFEIYFCYTGCMSKHKNKTAPDGKAWCSKCETYLPLDNFYKASATTLGVVHRCITCMKSDYKTEVKSKRTAYFSTPQGKASRMWADILSRAENKDGKHPTYKNVKVQMTRDEFLVWAVPQLDSWSKHTDISLASVDRVYNDKHYEISNLQLLDRWENARKTGKLKNDKAPEGYAWCGAYCRDYRPIYLFYKGSGTINGLSARCKKCTSRLGKEKRKKLL